MSIISSKAEHVYKGNTLMQEAHIPARKSCGRSSRQCKERQRKNESFR